MIAIDRREFVRRSGLFVLLISGSNFLTGCLFSGSIESQIAAYVNLGLNALASIIKILAANGIVIAAGTTIEKYSNDIKAAFVDVGQGIMDWQNAATADKATALLKVSEVVQILQNRIGVWWSSLNLPDGKLSTIIAALLSVVTTTLTYFQSQLPPPPATAGRMALPAKLAGPAVKRSSGQFKHDYNAIAESNGYKQFDI
jgi:hypothetical protein